MVVVVMIHKTHYTQTPIDNKLTNTRQHNKYLLEYIGYMFRPVNRSSSGLQQNKSQVLFRYWDPTIFTVVNVHRIWYWIKCETCNVWLKQNMSRYLTLWSGFITLRVLTGLWLFLYFHSVRWDLYGTASHGCLRCPMYFKLTVRSGYFILSVFPVG